jgi:hypothetical protein
MEIDEGEDVDVGLLMKKRKMQERLGGDVRWLAPRGCRIRRG